MKLLLTGAGGLLGSAVIEAAAARGDACHPLARPALDGGASAAAQLAQRMLGHDLLLHAAANTNVEQCETDPDACYRDNLLLTELLAQAAALAGVRMLFVSSTGLYGSASDAPYREYDAVAPTTHHHRGKLLAEQAVLAAAPHNLVVRTGWLFGGAPATPKNFVARRIDEARKALAEGRHLESNAEQRGVPCWNRDIAMRMLDLAAAGVTGVVNCVNSGNASRYEYVAAIVKAAGIAIEVQPSTAAGFNRKARVSNNEMADNWKMRALGWPEMPDWRASLQTYLCTELADY
ncbi:SDR family oxidoreductase [Duganella callida]|uniref:dTDP-4-dehydrorhamnose reductase n=1 Tax=Duganella callida TaxID=2561932 RepID=A0A4Y9SW41_9BURK|nr:sugar nucleotide-binding protein [Duganella callida]TFW29434.1 NAD-dependent epimerase/dehydratase family protein [Duganella callida]